MHESERRYHTNFGLKSGIPNCCVEFFISDWQRACSIDPELYMHHWNSMRQAEIRSCRRFNYIACPDCVLKYNFADLLSCGPDDTIDVEFEQNFKRFEPVFDVDNWVLFMMNLSQGFTKEQSEIIARQWSSGRPVRCSFFG